MCREIVRNITVLIICFSIISASTMPIYADEYLSDGDSLSVSEETVLDLDISEKIEHGAMEVQTDVVIGASEENLIIEAGEDSFVKDNSVENVTAEEGWDGISTKKVYEQRDIRYVFVITNTWIGGYNANVEIYNEGHEEVDNWAVNMVFRGKIRNIWNATIDNTKESMYTIKNAVWNADIMPGDKVSFGFTGDDEFCGFPESINMLGMMVEKNDRDYDVQYYLDHDWETGFTGHIVITNNSKETIEDWKLSFTFDREIITIWNATIESHDGNQYLVKNQGYNANIAPGQSASFGFEGKQGHGDDVPGNYRLNSYSLEDLSVEIEINDENLTYNESTDWYIVDDFLDSVTGTVTNPESIKKLDYYVKDINGNALKSGTIDPETRWIIRDFGLGLGYNELVFCITKNNGTINNTSFGFMNMSEDNLKNTDVDLSDTDLDGLNNYFESILETDKTKPDTDDDGLSDYDEFLYTATDPLVKDTDGNGVFDDYEDPDEDGLHNKDELRVSTLCLCADTDGDGLTDGDEVYIYNTNPLVYDSDEDGLNDIQEIDLGTDPNEPDTDGNGIIDSKEIRHQVIEQVIDNKYSKAVMSVTVELDCTGYLKDEMVIMDTYNLDMRSTDVVGLVGVPIDISTNTSFDEALITFKYDENELGPTKKEDIALMWYDADNDRYVILDAENNTDTHTVSYKTTHFSTYLLIDKKIWLDNMRMDLNYRDSGEIVYYDMAIVVDVSGSMGGKSLANARKAINGFIDAMSDNDRASLVSFCDYASRLSELTNDKKLLKTKVSELYADGGTNADEGIRAGITTLKTADKTKMMILLCDGDVKYNQSIVDSLIRRGITVHCINVINGSSLAMQQIAEKTGGMYYYAANSSDIVNVFKQLTENTIESVDMTDTDGDGLYDVFEANGMRLSNGQIVYTDPKKKDTDGDGIGDFDAMGGRPITETFTFDGNTYSCTLNHTKVYGKLSPEFIYVDGTPNSDGKQYYGKMSYITCPNNYYFDKYEIKKSYELFGASRDYYGAARIHNLFKDKLLDVSYIDKYTYLTINDDIKALILISTLDDTAYDVFKTYISGKGGDENGWVNGYTRKTIDISKYMKNDYNNSLYENFKNNFYRTKSVIENTMNEYNDEIYISVNPIECWDGCDYVEYANKHTLGKSVVDIATIMSNTAMFGTFNAANASITVHCKYNQMDNTYDMEYVYSIIDYYDYSFLKVLQDQDALGFTRSFELIGRINDHIKWKRGQPIQQLING